MKTNLLFGALIFTTVGFSQQHKCGFDAHNAKLNLETPGREQMIHEYMALANDFESSGDRTVYIIPVVVHVIHEGGESNISDEQILSGIDMLNEDFNRLNADTINTRNTGTAPFLPHAANVGFEFRMAKIDPLGNCTNGIERRYSPGASNNADDDAKHYSSGGLNAWNRSKYMNIWVVNSIQSDEGVTLGYAEFPYSGGSSDYGVIIRHDCYGTLGTSNSGERTLSHEMGHCLGLFHTFQEGCHTNDCGDNGDYCCDTPPESEAHWSCVTTLNSCTGFPTNDEYGFDALDQWENFMSYAPCQNMFSEDQKDIMMYNISDITFLANLTSAANATATGVTDPEELCKASFSAENTVICAGASIQFYDDSYYNVTGRTWNFDGGTPAISTDENPLITFNTPGVYTVSLEVTDGVSTVSDSETGYIIVLPANGESLPYVEGFESFTAFPDEQQFFNENSTGEEWDISTSAAYGGTQSLKLKNHGQEVGTIDAFISGTIDLSGVPATDEMIFTFRYAYNLRHADDNEYLRLYISKDCGETWVLRKNIQGDNLSETILTSQYTPLSPAEWFYVEVTNITSDYHVGNFRYKFEFTNDNGNNIYIDNINLYPTSMTDISESVGTSEFSIYPNPSVDFVKINYESVAPGECLVTITDALGQVVAVVYQGTILPGQSTFDYSTSHLESGVYFVNIASEGTRETLKFIKQ